MKGGAGIYDPRIPFIYFPSGARIAITGIHPSRSGKYVYTTYPQCTAAAAHSTPQWIPRWPSRCRRAALWQLCVESSPLAPKKKKEMTNETGSSSFKNRPPPLFCFKFSLLLLWIFLTA